MTTLLIKEALVLGYSIWMYPQTVNMFNKLFVLYKKDQRITQFSLPIFVLVFLLSHIPVFIVWWLGELIFEMFTT